MTTTIANIEKELSGLKKEVDDLHPHLKEFFSRLKNINRVEYTHGSNEWGADFILTKTDDLTGDSIYVGVLVKNKTLTQSTIDDVHKQIAECKMERLIGNGQHRVKMNEVWVIVNGNITKNAKDKIYQTQAFGVKLTDRKGLAGLMSKCNYSFSEGLPTHISICLSRQFHLAEKLKSQSVGLGFSESGSIFMDQRVVKRESTQYTHRGLMQKSRKSRGGKKISIKSAIKDNHTFVLYGEPGSGKSKMLQNVACTYAGIEEFKKMKMIPILISCKEMLEEHDKKIDCLIANFEEEHHLADIDSEFYYMVIIDGIDECNLPQDERLQIIREWKKESASEKIKKLIFASRDYIDPKIINIPIYQIADVSPKEIVRIIKEQLSYLDTVNQIIIDLQHSNIFHSLPKSPLATIILIDLLKDEKGRHELPANLTDLFEKYVECSLGRWDTDIEEGVKQKRYEAADKILTRIAVYMLDQGITQLNENEAKGFFQKYLSERNLGINQNELFDRITIHSNLIYLDDGIFRFRHKTIAEFFYAKSFSNAKLDELGESVFDIWWTHVLFFWIGLQKDCPKQLEKINAIKPQHEYGKVMKAINMANILLAGYATPYDHIQNILKSIFIDTSEHIENVLNKRVENSGFYKLSIMRTLFFFRLIMDHEYSRPFFKKAIENGLIEIEDLNIDDNIKATSLFLLNLAHASLDGEDIFTGMIRKLGNRIPPHILLAINHETDVIQNVKGDIKKFKRTLQKSLLSEKSNIGYLYNKQIRYLPNPDK